MNTGTAFIFAVAGGVYSEEEHINYVFGPSSKPTRYLYVHIFRNATNLSRISLFDRDIFESARRAGEHLPMLAITGEVFHSLRARIQLKQLPVRRMRAIDHV